MRQVKYHVASTVDGFIAHPDGSYDGFPMVGEHVDEFVTSLGSYDTVLMGTNTYEIGLKAGVTYPYPPLKHYVFSHSLDDVDEPDVEMVRSDAAEFVRKLKAQPGKDIWLCGGATLAATLLDAKLIDELIIKLNPRLFGTGISLTAGTPGIITLDLLATKAYKTGVVLLTYRVNYA
ncbi:MAG TPA: dihydrofolate reductase family protein [Actinophytocola sp.]|uniref:dihydrofolate reductase family protein n=1 Tax=Actinophytocola sp. TaxID=1872138 RepID=UPI002DDD7954|nr:dihydrofolate reductase family protein [Actinophytocola sp.]HEV2783210.1 dihydrofolate reductase family protein [Actinophytocola sp.]